MLFAINNLQASGVNLLMNDFAAGLPSPLSFLGFGDAIARDLGLSPWSACTLPILHSVNISEGRTKPEMENEYGSFKPVGMMEDLTGLVEVSVLINLPEYDDDDGLRRTLSGRRLGGGTIQNNDWSVKSVPPDGSAFSQIRRGYAMVRPEVPERLQITTGKIGELEAIAAELFPPERQPSSGWIVPVAVGHHLLENPDTAPKRSGTRASNIPHVFTEPVLGIAELVSVRNKRLTKLTMEELVALLWSWDARGEYVLGHAAYHPECKNY